MKKILFSITAAFIAITGFSQSISRITITGSGQVDVIAFGLGEQVQIYLTKDGNISKWGYDRYIGYQENYEGKLDPYVGRIEYYSQNDDEALRGKVKYIGRTLLTYYSSYEKEELKGKLKSIGAVNIEYYLNYEDAAYRGNIKTLGQNAVTWYASYENADMRGKLKSLGSTAFTYYGSFEDKAFRGKIKSIDRYNITYYSSFEQYSGNIKSGPTIFNVNNVKYYLKNY
jgi:hypothetical protein